jgi:hypothetical protein
MTDLERDQAGPFDWGVLGENWWLEAAKSVGADERQTKFAAAKYRGCSNTDSARQAGYTDNTDAIRQVGYRCFRTRTCQTLLALAAAEGKGGVDGTADDAECERMLTNLMRGSDPNIKIRAAEALQKLRERKAEREREARENSLEADSVVPTSSARMISSSLSGNPRLLKLRNKT